MRAEDVLTLLKTRPFAPLRIHMVDGETYDVYRPEQVLVLRSRIAVGLPPRSETGILDRVEHCSLSYVDRVEVLSSASETE